MKKSIYWVSIGIKIMVIIFMIIFISITIVISIFNPIWYALLFLAILIILFLFYGLVAFFNRIVLDVPNKRIILYTPKRKQIELDNLLDIYIDTTYSRNIKKYCFVVFKMKEGKVIKIPQYTALLSSNAVYITKCKIDELKYCIEGTKKSL